MYDNQNNVHSNIGVTIINTLIAYTGCIAQSDVELIVTTFL